MFWGYIAQALNIGAGLILLPIILHYLSPEDVGLWFVFITLAGLTQLLELGFNPTLARNAAYVYAGAQTLAKHGLPKELEAGGAINLKLLANLVASARKIYQIVAALASIVLLVGGSYYITSLMPPNKDATVTLIAWVFFSSGYIAAFYYGYVNGLLQGRGDVTQANKVVVITRSVLILLGAVAVVAGYGLLGLGVASMLASILGRWIAVHYFYSVERPEMHSLRIKSNIGNTELIKTLWHNASRLGAVQVGAFLIQRGNILIASSFLGLAATASYGMTVTILMALSGVATVICQVQMPHMNSMQAKGDRKGLTAIYGEILIVSWVMYICGLLLLMIFGNDLLEIISSKTQLLPTALLLLLGLVLLLELNHTIAATYLTTVNKIPFLSAALISGLGIVLIAFILVKPMGALGLILAQGLVQLTYNNWKWPKEAIAHLQSKFMQVIILGVKRIAHR